jgi:two-component system, sensor histidine kinase
LVYYVSGKAGLAVAFVHPSASPVWAPTGIAFAALLVFGRGVWPGVAIGAFFVNYTTFGSLLTSLLIAAGNTAEALLGVTFTKRFANGTAAFLRGRDVFRFVLYAGLLSTMISPSIGVTSLALNGYADWSRYGPMWLTWWLGDVGGNLVVAPFLVLWTTSPPQWQSARSLEAGALLLAIGVLGSFVVFPWPPIPESGYPPIFLSFPLILWAAFSFGPRGSAAAVLLLSVVATWATVVGIGPFAIGSPNQSLLILDSFVAVLSLTSMGLGAVVQEQRSTAEALKGADRQLKTLLRREQGERMQAEAMSRAKDQFLAVLGHELRSPLAAISHAASALQKLDREPRRKNLIAIMDRQSRFLGRLVDDLLDVSRLDSGKVRLVTELIDLQDVVERCLAAFRASGTLRDRVVTTDLRSAWVLADATRLIQVVTNILENAAKFTAPGGHIAVAVETGTAAVLRIRDDGRGIDARTLPHIFDFFAQADDALDRSHGGLGIGLTVVRRLVELHGGTVDASSEGVGRGSEFVVRLPLQPPPAVAAAKGETAATPHRAEKLRVLVVEDYDDSREALEICVRMLGHEVASAETGEGGIKLAIDWRPDVGLVDIGLPGIDGYEVAKQIRATTTGKSVRLYAVTGYGEPDTRRRALDAGFDDCLVKPVDPDRLAWMLSGAASRAATA